MWWFFITLLFIYANTSEDPSQTHIFPAKSNWQAND
jgi:hypothetical protein